MTKLSSWVRLKNFILDSWILRDPMIGFLLQFEGLIFLFSGVLSLMGAITIAFDGNFVSTIIATIAAVVFAAVGYIFLRGGLFIQKNASVNKV